MPSITHLNQLEADGLISLNQVIPEPAYWFRHALVQETAYQSLVRQDRRELHLATGEVLEAIFRDKLEEHAPLLAHHFSLGGDDQRALQYYQTAANTASRRYANAEAVMHYLDALRIAKQPKMAPSITPQTWLDLHLNLGYAYQRLLNYELALDTFQALENFGHRMEEPRLELEAILAQAVIFSTPTPKFNPDLSEIITNRAIELSTSIDDQPNHARALWLLMLQNYFSNQIDHATRFGLEAMQLCREFGLKEQLGFLLNDMGSFIYPMTGQYHQALDSLLEARAIFQESNNLVMLSDNLTNSALDHFLFGEFEQGNQSLESAYRISMETGNLWGEAFSLWCYGFYYVETLNLGEAINILLRADKLSTMSDLTIGRVMTNLILGVLYNRIGDGENGRRYATIGLQVAEGQSIIWRIYGNSILAYSYLLLGERERAHDSLNIVVDITGSPKNTLAAQLNLTDFLVAMSEYQLSINQPEPVLEFTSLFLNHPHFPQAIAALPYYQYYRARALSMLGEQSQAQDLLLQAEETAFRLGLNWILWQIFALQAELYFRVGDTTRSIEYQTHAVEIINKIVASAGDSDLGNQFLTQRAVEAILSNPVWSERKSGGE